MRLLRIAVGLLAGAAAIAFSAAALEVPYLSGRINDLAGVLSPDAEDRLAARLAALEEERGAQIAVLTIASLEGEVLEDYSLRVAETWKLGRGEFDDGALLLISRDDRKMRLEVGYGLEPVLTDLASKRILDDVIRPRFRAGDFDGGVEQGLDVVARLVRGEENALPPPGLSSSSKTQPLAGRIFGLAIFSLVVGTFSLSALAGKGCSGWFLYFFLMPFWFIFPTVLLSPSAGRIVFVLWVVGFPILRLLLHQTVGGQRYMRRQDRTGGWTTWSSSRSGGFSGGGFSGGGGSFGGGGASGSW